MCPANVKNERARVPRSYYSVLRKQSGGEGRRVYTGGKDDKKKKKRQPTRKKKKEKRKKTARALRGRPRVL